MCSESETTQPPESSCDRQDFTAELKSKYGAEVKFDKNYGKKKPEEIDLSSPLGLLQLWAKLLAGPTRTRAGKDTIAIVYVEGPIMPGKAEPSPFSVSGAAYSTPISKALDQAAKDNSIKAVVLRVDSPGGSATASEIILNATRRVKAEKPLVVSMGNVAGSGGYQVACASDTIFADASTITASIGVVSGKFATTPMWNKVGISWQSYSRGANSRLLSPRDVFTVQLLSDVGGSEQEEDDDTVSLSLDPLRSAKSSPLLKAALPYHQGLDPQRVGAIQSVIERLTLLEKENVILTMPEIQFCD